MANLKSMSVTDLLDLRKKIDHCSCNRSGRSFMPCSPKLVVAAAQQMDGRSPKQKGRRSLLITVDPKTGEEWSGRGGTAKWLTAEIKSGKKKESFLIK